MLVSSTLSSLVVAALTFTMSIQASPTPRTPQISCNYFDAEANYIFLSHASPTGNSLPGFNSTYLLSDALKAIGSTSSAGDNPQVLQNLGPFTGDDFKFVTCASSFMKYPAKTNGTDGIPRYYGHIEPSTNPNGTCLTRTTVADGHEFFTNSPCRYNDDAGQEAQYFQLKQVAYEPAYQNVTWNLTLLGHPQGASGDKFYFTPGSTAKPAITVARNKPSGFQLGLEYIHIN